MRIGIDCRTILNPDAGERAGVGHYTYHLVRHLIEHDQQNEYVLFFDYRMAREGTQEFTQPNVKIKFFPFSSYGKFLPFAYSHMLVSAALLKERLNVFHAPANVFPLVYPKKTIITVHDLAIFKHPEWFPSQIFSTRLLVPRSLKRARHIIAVSQSTKCDLQDIFSVPSRKITVIPEAVDTKSLPLIDQDDDVRSVYKLPAKFLLFIGTIEPRKNLLVLFEAWHRLQQMRPEAVKGANLVIAGSLGHRGKDIIATIKQRRLNKSIRFLGYVSHNHKIRLIKAAQGFVFPSLYEGFGLPVLEALQLGTPVITSNTSSLPEVAGSAAILIDPTDVDALAMGMRDLLTKPVITKALIKAGKQQAQKFSWANAAAETLKVYEQIMRPNGKLKGNKRPNKNSAKPSTKKKRRK